ncbi:MAG: helix-turn-helix domain-containing protein [Ruminococcus sp.]|nr:helix-turn-helix domain-containing protein [Ruminococcus sp.]
MKIVFNIDVLYRLMRDKNIETISQLSKMSDITDVLLYRAVNRGIASKEIYWKLAKSLGCHVEDLQTVEKS